MHLGLFSAPLLQWESLISRALTSPPSMPTDCDGRT
ncbi:hypothetical protein GDO81_010552 [Engystomops pustulosus]|uniref:Uncharacterized protein n=1 Tax=Engystomops pustulosus TaxID=76066 RepID=A0AAV7C1Q3_ENGPU|nr:hypothetical protein GDO81_010552 [Engystomops pustulosus]